MQTLKRYLVTYCITLFLSSSVCQADPNPAHIVDRLVLRLTGLPASQAQIDAYIKKEKTLWQIADDLKYDPLVEQRLAQFWMQKIGIKASTNWGEISWQKGPISANRILKLRYFFEGTDGDSFSVRAKTSCSVAQGYDAATMHDPYLWAFNDHDKIKRHPELNAATVTAASTCSCAGPVLPVKVNPWWAPSKQVFTCSAALDPTICGPQLRKCNPSGGTIYYPNQFIDDVIDTMTMEPGFIAAKTIIHDRPWTEVLTSTKGVAAPGFLAWLGNPNFSLILRQVALPGSYPEIDTDPNIQASLADPSDTGIRDQLNNSRYVWYERGQKHAGALTTLSFILEYNGARAYARQARETFLCKPFEVPEGVKQVVSDEPDLTKKPYCSSCHIVLEPLAKFWDRFPPVGSEGYFYNETNSAQGSYAGQSGQDVTGLAKIFAGTEEFKTCAVKRSFEFLVGREMNQGELVSLLPLLVTRYDSSGGRLWPVLTEIMTTQAFTGVAPTKVD
jgi:hypothetical protein